MLNVAMLGAAGRMGRTIVPLIVASTDLRLCGALAAAGDAHIGHDAGVVAGAAPLAVSITSDVERALEGDQVAIDGQEVTYESLCGHCYLQESGGHLG